MSARLFCYYGDDFTGSTDALEALAANGVPSVLFLGAPADEDLAMFPDCQAIGIAGESRSRSPEWMSVHLPAIFRSLREYGAPICQYKVCSTFDSSPECGSIGRALEIGRAVFNTPYVPIVIAAPHLRRYVVFGNLFALGGGAIHRIDRHPTMSRHPVTPMHEADLRLHLARQTNARSSLLDIRALVAAPADEELDALLREDPDAILFDGINSATLAETGRLLCAHPPLPSFAVGSSGLTHALIYYWREAGIVKREPPSSIPAAVDRLIVVSGSCSPVTEAQIRRALANGFAGLRVALSGGDGECVLRQALALLQEGRSVVLYTALGPADRMAGAGGELLGNLLGELLRELMMRSGVRRAVIAGGDTSTHAVRKLGVFALSFAGLTVPGAPLCRTHSRINAADGLELVLKGGQIGPEDYFERVRKGGES
jgi:uncharacterized protein YgbK (DUF1537 family)